jgi:sortase (surface protein transpeptidase)
MDTGSSKFKRLALYAKLLAVYAVTVGVIVYAIAPGSWFEHNDLKVASSDEKPKLPVSKSIAIISGLPTRIVIPSEQVDLPLLKGYYNPSNGGWNLSGYDGQFGMFSDLANDAAGDTFVYGHNNNFVFGALRHHTPLPGALALVYTSNGHIFKYAFDSVTSVAPDDISILNYSGPPIMTIQTCTGSLNEWRTMYKFSFSGVVA